MVAFLQWNESNFSSFFSRFLRVAHFFWQNVGLLLWWYSFWELIRRQSSCFCVCSKVHFGCRFANRCWCWVLLYAWLFEAVNFYKLEINVNVLQQHFGIPLNRVGNAENFGRGLVKDLVTWLLFLFKQWPSFRCHLETGRKCFLNDAFSYTAVQGTAL